MTQIFHIWVLKYIIIIKLFKFSFLKDYNQVILIIKNSKQKILNLKIIIKIDIKNSMKKIFVLLFEILVII